MMNLEVLFACVLLNVDLTLFNIISFTRHEIYKDMSEGTRHSVDRLFSIIKKFGFLLREYPQTFLQHVVNEGGDETFIESVILA